VVRGEGAGADGVAPDRLVVPGLAGDEQGGGLDGLHGLVLLLVEPALEVELVVEELGVVEVEVAVVVGHLVEVDDPDLVGKALLVGLLEELHLDALLGLLVQQVLQVHRGDVLVLALLDHWLAVVAAGLSVGDVGLHE